MSYQCDALWSINERLAGRPGMDFPRLGILWLDDMLTMAEREAEAIEDVERGAKSRSRFDTQRFGLRGVEVSF